MTTVDHAAARAALATARPDHHARRGQRVAMLDEADAAYRASRGNFGLVWVQGKGRGFPPYARWTRHSSDLWADFAAELRESAGIDVAHRRPGGVVPALQEEELAAEVASLEQLRRESGNHGYDFEVLDHARLAELCPGLGPEVVGGTYCPQDGDVNPLRLMRALHTGFARAGGHYVGGTRVARLQALPGGGFRLRCSHGEMQAEKVVIAAGLGSRELAAQVGIAMPVRPVQGQSLITERAPAHRLDLPTLPVRQVDEGGFQLGYSTAEVGMDLHTRAPTPDGFPLYEQSARCPGAFGVTCHSGVTLAAAHALDVAGWVAGGAIPQDYAPFSSARLDVSPAA